MDTIEYMHNTYYFITICTHHHACLFGEVVNNEMHLNEAGLMVAGAWQKNPHYYIGSQKAAFMVMPNHIHAILIISYADVARGNNQNTVINIIENFKLVTVEKYNTGIARQEWQPYTTHLWQDSFYGKTIRSKEEFERVRDYIRENPSQWKDEIMHSRQVVDVVLGYGI